MSTEIDRLAAARPTPAETTDLVGPEERQALLDRILRTDRTAGLRRAASPAATAGSSPSAGHQVTSPAGADGLRSPRSGDGRVAALGETQGSRSPRSGERRVGSPVGAEGFGSPRLGDRRVAIEGRGGSGSRWAGSRGGRRRVVRRAAWVGVPAAAAGVAVVVALAVAAPTVAPEGSGGGPPAAGGSASGEQTVSFVLARARTALGDSRELVQHTVVGSFRGCSSETWVYLGTAAGSPRQRFVEKCGGVPSQDIGTVVLPDRSGRAVNTSVRHFERSWSRGVLKIGTDVDVALGAESSPAQLRQQLEDGDWTLVGRERLGGRDTLHLRAVGRPGGPPPQLWVDASSFLVVRTLVVKGGPGEWVPLRKDFDWRPATAAAMADFEVRVPPGYRRTGG